MDKSRILEAIRNGSVDPFFSSLYHKDSPSAPPAPDYAAAAQAQGAANVDTARTQGRMNNPNIYTPYGSQTVTWGQGQPQFNQSAYDQAMQQYQTASANPSGNIIGYEQGPDADSQRPIYGPSASLAMPTREQFTTTGSGDQPTVTQTLAPAQQQLLDAQNRISNNLAGVAESGLNRVGQGMAQPFDTSQLRPLQADAAARQAAQDAAYRQATARLDPQWQTAGDMQETKLRNQGLAPGGEAYTNAMRDFNFGKNDAYSSAFNNSFNTGLAAQQADFGMQNQANQANLQQQAYLRQLPLNELNALRTGSQVQNPQFQPYQGSQIGQTPIMQGAMAQGQADQNAYNAQVGQNNAFTSGLFGLGGAALMSPAGTFPGMINMLR